MSTYLDFPMRFYDRFDPSNGENHEALRMYLPEEKRVLVGDITKAFSLSPDLQEGWLYYAKRQDIRLKEQDKTQLMLNSSFDLALRSLNFERLKELRDDYISDEEIQALLKRRDKLLQPCSPK